MDKEYMLITVRKRIKELTAAYEAACDDKTVDGRSLSSNGAGTKRSRLKRDIQLLILIEQLLLTSRAVFIEDEDAIDGFDRLVEPRTSKYGG